MTALSTSASRCGSAWALDELNRFYCVVCGGAYEPQRCEASGRASCDPIGTGGGSHVPEPEDGLGWLLLDLQERLRIVVADPVDYWAAGGDWETDDSGIRWNEDEVDRVRQAVADRTVSTDWPLVLQATITERIGSAEVDAWIQAAAGGGMAAQVARLRITLLAWALDEGLQDRLDRTPRLLQGNPNPSLLITKDRDARTG